MGFVSVPVLVVSPAFILPTFIAAAGVAYLLGCINGSILVSKYFMHDDIRGHGSGNAGLTNFYRTFGLHGIVGVLLSDILKAVIAVLIGRTLFVCAGGEALRFAGEITATTFVLAGHMFPFMFGFHGGKGVLSGISSVCVINWKIGLLLILVFIVIVALTRFVSLGSVTAAALFLPCVWFAYGSVFCVSLAAVPVALLIFAHRSNIVRLVHGKENKFSIHRNKTEGGK